MDPHPKVRKHSTIPPEVAGVQLSSSCVRGLYEALVALGHDATAFLSCIQLDAQRLSASDEWFSLAEVDAMFCAAVKFTGDPTLGLHWGERSPMMQFDLGPALLASAPSLRALLEVMAQLQHIFVNRTVLSSLNRLGRSTITLRLLAVSETGMRLMTEVALARFVRGFQLGSTAPFSPAKLRMLYPTHDTYVSKVEAAALEAREKGFLLAEDQTAILDAAHAAAVPP